MARKPPAAPAAKTPKPASDKFRIIVLRGPEEMVKREQLDRVRAALAAKQGELETFAFDGKAVALADVLDELRSFSLMQQYKLVIVDDADVFVTAHREPLERYAGTPVENATLVLRSVKWNAGNLDKLIEKVGEVCKCEPLPSREVPAWINNRATAVHGRKIEPRAASLLAERLGGDLSLIDNELAKLSVMSGEKEPISVALVEQLVGRSSEEDAWAIQESLLEALAKPNSPEARGAAIEKLHELIDLAGQPKELVTYFIADAVRKLYSGAMMKKQGMNDFQIGKELKLWGPKQEAFTRVLRQLTPASAGRLLDRVVDLDVRAKTGRGEGVRNLECFCSTMGDGLN